MHVTRVALVALASSLLLSGCFLWPFGGDEEEPRKRTVLFSGGEEIEEDTSGGVCAWDGRRRTGRARRPRARIRAYRARTRVCKDGTFRQCLESGRWRVTGTC